MADQTKHIAIDAPDGPTVLAARHLDATEGPVQIGATVTTATRSAIDRVLRYIAKAHNSPATDEREPVTEYADIVFTRHQGQAITVDGPAPQHTRIHLTALMDRYAYLHMPTSDTIVFADQVVYKVTAYRDGALELELVEDWRPATNSEPKCAICLTPVSQHEGRICARPGPVAAGNPVSKEEYEALKAKWQQTHGNEQAAHVVTEVKAEEQP